MGKVALIEAIKASQVVLVVKNTPANAGDAGDAGSISVLQHLHWYLGWEDPLEMATHSIIFAWKISWAEEPGRP